MSSEMRNLHKESGDENGGTSYLLTKGRNF